MLKNLKLIITVISGSAFEYYDFCIYGVLAPRLAELFFPSHDKSLSLLTAFASFMIGFMVRPLGGLIFGHIGDRWGRKKAFLITILLMGFSTTAIGLLPTYAVLGKSASIALILFRLIQGLALGGEFSGSIVYLIEHAPADRRGLWGSFVMLSAFGGLLLSTILTGLSLFIFSAEQAWRFPFLASILLCILGFYLRLKLPETPFFENLNKKRSENLAPVKQILFQHTGSIIQIVGINILGSSGFFLLFIYLPSFLNTELNFSLKLISEINSICLISSLLLIPFFGYLSDKYGRKKILLLSSSFFMLFSYPLFQMILSLKSSLIVLAQFIFTLMLSAFCSTTPAVFSEKFTTSTRYTGVAFTYNLANTLFGGTLPLFMTIGFRLFPIPNLSAWILILASGLSLSFIFFLKETYRSVLI